MRKLLVKDANRRYQSATELNLDLRQLREDLAAGNIHVGSPAVTGAELRTPAAVSLKIGAPLAVLLVAAGVYGGRLTLAPGASPVGAVRLEIAIDSDLSLVRGGGRSVAISPDGQTVVFAATREGTSQLFSRSLQDFDVVPIAGTEGGRAPFFSPDSRSLGFLVDSPGLTSTMRIDVGGGQPTTICQTCPVVSGGAGDDVVFAQGSTLWKVPWDGGTRTSLGELEEAGSIGGISRATMLPGGRGALVQIRSGPLTGVGVFDLETRAVRVIAEGGSDPQYVGTGHVLFQRDGSLFAVGFDPEELEAIGEPAQVLEGIFVETGGAAQLSVSANGTLVYVPGTAMKSQLVWLERDGTAELLPAEPDDYLGVQLSPDDQRAAVWFGDYVNESYGQVFIVDLDVGTRRQLTFEGVANMYPIWSHDGVWVYFSSNRDGGTFDLYRRRADGSGAAEPVARSEHDLYITSVSANGTLAAVEEYVADESWNVGTLVLGTPSELRRLPVGGARPRFPHISPDGRFVAYHCCAVGDNTIIVQEIESNQRWTITRDFARAAVWSPRGDEIFFRGALPGSRSVVPVRIEPEFDYDAAAELFTAPGLQAVFDVSSDGQRIMGVVPQGIFGAASNAAPRIHVVTNWFEELKERVPSGR